MNRLDQFSEIAARWRCGSRFRDERNPNGHDYAATYVELLRGRDVRRILEFGIGPAKLFDPEQVTGAGLRMWSEVFPEADVFGVDVRQDLMVNEGRIRSFACDQSSESDLRQLAVEEFAGMRFDLIVDDGSHLPEDQEWTARVFLPLLSERGVYVIEDVLPGVTTMLLEGFMAKIVELRISEAVDDRLIVIEREAACSA